MNKTQGFCFFFSCIKPRLLPHLLKWFEQRHYSGKDASNTFVPALIKDWSGNILSGRYDDTVRCCLIHKYNNYELFLKTQKKKKKKIVCETSYGCANGDTIIQACVLETRTKMEQLEETVITFFINDLDKCLHT